MYNLNKKIHIEPWLTLVFKLEEVLTLTKFGRSKKSKVEDVKTTQWKPSASIYCLATWLHEISFGYFSCVNFCSLHEKNTFQSLYLIMIKSYFLAIKSWKTIGNSTQWTILTNLSLIDQHGRINQRHVVINQWTII